MKSLKLALLANATFSLISGLSLVIFSSSISDIMGVPNSQLLLFIGIALLLFELMVTFAAFGKPINPKLVKSIILQDWVWVIGSVGIVSLQAFNLTMAGYWLISLVAIIVALFAFLQTRYLKLMGA